MNPCTVLIFEKTPLVAMHISALISDMGHTPISVATESEAVAAASVQKPDLMIFDTSKCIGDVFAVVTQIMGDGYIPHIYLSGAVLDNAPIDSKAVVITKPFTESLLIQTAQGLLATPAAETASVVSAKLAPLGTDELILNRIDPLPKLLLRQK